MLIASHSTHDCAISIILLPRNQDPNGGSLAVISVSECYDCKRDREILSVTADKDFNDLTFLRACLSKNGGTRTNLLGYLLQVFKTLRRLAFAEAYRFALIADTKNVEGFSPFLVEPKLELGCELFKSTC